MVESLIKENLISGKIFPRHSWTFEANVRENNLKTTLTHRFDKRRQLKGDPDFGSG